MNYLLEQIHARALTRAGCTKDEALHLLAHCPADELQHSAEKLREHFFDNKIQLCAIINARSGACSENCRYCSQSAHNSAKVTVYDLLPQPEILAQAQKLATSGAANFGIVTSGATVAGQDLAVLCQTVSQIKPRTGLCPCASLGRFSRQELSQLKAAGLARYHHNLETSQRFYPSICTTHNWQERVDTVKAALAAGLEVCSGGLFGLGENWEDRIDLALTLRNLNIKNVPLNFLHSHPGTPLANIAPLSTDEALKIIALYRHLLPDATLRICGGRPKILGCRQGEIFAWGANGLMTGNYLTTDGITPENDRQMIESLGLIIDKD